MDAHQICYKLFFEADGGLELGEFIDVFHEWIREEKLGTEDVTIDVADYAHVQDGPGVLLVCHEGHYVVEHRHGRWALVYNRKRGGEGAPVADRLLVPLRRLARAAALLSTQAGFEDRITFRTDELLLLVQNRLHSPNEDATFDAISPAIQDALAKPFGGATLSMQREGDQRELFRVRIKSDRAASLADLAA